MFQEDRQAVAQVQSANKLIAKRLPIQTSLFSCQKKKRSTVTNAISLDPIDQHLGLEENDRHFLYIYDTQWRNQSVNMRTAIKLIQNNFKE